MMFEKLQKFHTLTRKDKKAFTGCDDLFLVLPIGVTTPTHTLQCTGAYTQTELTYSLFDVRKLNQNQRSYIIAVTDAAYDRIYYVPTRHLNVVKKKDATVLVTLKCDTTAYRLSKIDVKCVTDDFYDVRENAITEIEAEVELCDLENQI